MSQYYVHENLKAFSVLKTYLTDWHFSLIVMSIFDINWDFGILTENEIFLVQRSAGMKSPNFIYCVFCSTTSNSTCPINT